MRKIILLLLVMACPFKLLAANTGVIVVPAAGEHYYWFSYLDVNDKQVRTCPRGFKDKKATVDLPLVKDAVPECKLFVLDAKTGNEAIIEVQPKKGQQFKFELKPGDFDTVRRVEVAITSAADGRPAAGAVVTLKDSAGNIQTQVLEPTAKGIVQFLDLPSGVAKVTVNYGEGFSMSQDVEIPLDREARVMRINLPIAGEIETLETTAPEKETTRNKEETPGRSASRYDWISGVIGLIIFVLIVYVAHRMLSDRGVRFLNLLRRLGVDIKSQEEPVPGQAQPAQQTDPTICPFCGGKKDPVTGACACTISPGTATGPVVSSGPRLVATQGTYLGNIYPLEGTLVTIGREESCDIAFPRDPTVSRKHARLVNENGEWTIHDEGSSNGTFVNGVKVSDQAIKPGDEITIGSTRLRFEV